MRVSFLLPALLLFAACDATSPPDAPVAPEVITPSPAALDADAIAEFDDGASDPFRLAGDVEISHSYAITSGWYSTPETGRVDCPEVVEHSMSFSVTEGTQRFSFILPGESLADLETGTYEVDLRSPTTTEGCLRNEFAYNAGYRDETNVGTSFQTRPVPRDTTDLGMLTLQREEDGTLSFSLRALMEFVRSYGDEQPGDDATPPLEVEATFRVQPDAPVTQVPGPPLELRGAVEPDEVTL